MHLSRADAPLVALEKIKSCSHCPHSLSSLIYICVSGGGLWMGCTGLLADAHCDVIFLSYILFIFVSVFIFAYLDDVSPVSSEDKNCINPKLLINPLAAGLK